jgi:hypothetical protein
MTKLRFIEWSGRSLHRCIVAGNASPGNNCIGVLKAPHWSGPYQLANPLPVTHPESEDPFVFRTKRGYHLLTNVNNDHARCASQCCTKLDLLAWVNSICFTKTSLRLQSFTAAIGVRTEGVACGGHAWGTDGLHFSNLTIGKSLPVLLIEYSRKNEVNRPSFSQRDRAKKSRRRKPCLQHRTDQIFHFTELERPIATWMIAGENTHRRVRARHRSEEWFRVAERLHRATSSEPHLSNH